jgi:putative cell wall-binding protein
VGGSMGVSAETETRLRAAGCKVERIPGNTPDLIQAVMEELAASGQRFLTLKA